MKKLKQNRGNMSSLLSLDMSLTFLSPANQSVDSSVCNQNVMNKTHALGLVWCLPEDMYTVKNP